MERRFKIGLVSNHILVQEGNNFDKKLMANLPDCVKILSKANEYRTGSLALVLYHPEWDVVEEGCELERVIIKFKDTRIQLC